MGLPNKGQLAFVLHAHLPFIRHPEHAFSLEERWFFEAVTETYIPVLSSFQRLVADSVPFRITVSLSPTLLSMLEDSLLAERYLDHVGGLIALTEREIERHWRDPRRRALAAMYRGLFTEARDVFLKYEGRLARGFAELHHAGAIELVTTSATHGILPLLASQSGTVEAQLATGFDYFERVFGFRPEGMWLPECAYSPDLDAALHRHGIRYFVLEAHGIDSSEGRDGGYVPAFTTWNAAGFARDRSSTRQVWSADEGYPGDPVYREFYRDLGFDDDDGSAAELLGLGFPAPTGIKYHRVTGATEDKELYDPSAALKQASLHARAFLEARIEHFGKLAGSMRDTPIVVAPFDAELFGHWWFEGPAWLESFVRQVADEQQVFELVTPSDYLEEHDVGTRRPPRTSTWGQAGYFETWLNPRTDWVFELLVDAADRLRRVASGLRGDVERGLPETRPQAPIDRAMKQAVRELLLAQSSDWSFIITQGTSVEYAERRVRDHVARLHWLLDAVESDAVDEERLAALEYMNPLFPDVDWKHFAAASHPGVAG